VDTYRPRFVPPHEAEAIKESVANLFKQFLEAHPEVSSIVRGLRVEFGEDFSGQPAIWIYFLVNETPSPSIEDGARLNELATFVTTGLVQKGVTPTTGWPYVSFVSFQVFGPHQVSRGSA